MKLEKDENVIMAKFTDNHGALAYQTNIALSASCYHDKMRITFEAETKIIIADLNKSKVEQLIYVLTLARNRMK